MFCLAIKLLQWLMCYFNSTNVKSSKSSSSNICIFVTLTAAYNLIAQFVLKYSNLRILRLKLMLINAFPCNCDKFPFVDKNHSHF